MSKHHSNLLQMFNNTVAGYDRIWEVALNVWKGFTSYKFNGGTSLRARVQNYAQDNRGKRQKFLALSRYSPLLRSTWFHRHVWWHCAVSSGGSHYRTDVGRCRGNYNGLFNSLFALTLYPSHPARPSLTYPTPYLAWFFSFFAAFCTFLQWIIALLCICWSTS